MTSRERVKRAVHFGGPDRIPHFLPDGKGNDILWLWQPGPQERQAWAPTANGRQRRIDAWGVVWETMGGGASGEAVEWPVEITRQGQYAMPDVNNPRYFQKAREAVAANNAQADPLYCLGVMPISSLHAGTHAIMGLERMLAAYFEHPGDLKALLERMAAGQRESIRMLHQCGCDGVMGYDDWGLQDRLMVSPKLFEEFFAPLYRRNWSYAHELGMDVWLHSCGNILEILPTLAQCGLNVIQMDQQENMALERLNERVGGRLAFWCPVDIQQTMVCGSIQDVRAYVRRMMATVGAHRGGLISMAYSSPDAIAHDPAKTAAMCQAFREYGIYEG